MVILAVVEDHLGAGSVAIRGESMFDRCSEMSQKPGLQSSLAIFASFQNKLGLEWQKLIWSCDMQNARLDIANADAAKMFQIALERLAARRAGA